MLCKIILFLADNIGSSVSVSSIGNTLVNEGLLESYFYYDIKRFDIKGKEYLRVLAEVDFAAAKADDKLYVQVTESMTSEEVRYRELAPLQKINDNDEKSYCRLNSALMRPTMELSP